MTVDEKTVDLVDEFEVPMEFNEYVNSQMLSQLSQITEFSFVVDVPPIGAWSENKFVVSVADQLYDKLQEIVKEAGFFYEDELEIVTSPEELAVQYRDDRYDFVITLRKGSINIQRRGSSFENFHRWYCSLMPFAHQIVTSALAIFHKQLPFERYMNALRASYAFQFILYDIVPNGKATPVKNAVIMQQLVKGSIGDDGTLTELEEALEATSRTDVNMSRWSGEEGNRRLLRYSVEAPANMEWKSLWVRFSYSGQAYTSPTGEREAFDPTVLNEWSEAYLGFLRDFALNGFLASLMHGYHFKTATSSRLP